jgi:hypothetical protein
MAIILYEISDCLQVDKNLFRKEKDSVYKREYPRSERIIRNWKQRLKYEKMQS